MTRLVNPLWISQSKSMVGGTNWTTYRAHCCASYSLHSGSDGDFSKVGKVNLTKAMLGGQVNTTVGSNGNGTLVAPGGGSGGGSGVGSSSSASKLSFEWTFLAGVLAILVGFWVG